MTLEPADLNALLRARELLEHPSLAMRLSNLVGSPLEKGMARLPPVWQHRLAELAHEALGRAMETAARTLAPGPRRAQRGLHKVLGSLSGGAGGAFGLVGLPVEIPLSTVLMMRTILDIARAHGEDTADPATQLAALEVFAFGGSAPEDDAAESGYYAVRAMLAGAVTEAVRHVARKGLAQEGAPALVRLIALVAARYQVQLTQKAAGMMVPGIGAAAGVTINLLFMQHFQNMSEGHFTIRRLERRYGAETVSRAYLG